MTIDDHIAAVRNRRSGVQSKVIFMRVDEDTWERLVKAAKWEGVSTNTLAWAAILSVLENEHKEAGK